MGFADGSLNTSRYGGSCDVFNINYDKYDYVEQERRDHPYDDSFYLPPLQQEEVPFLHLIGEALIEKALADKTINKLHLADLSHIQDPEQMNTLLEFVRSRTWEFVELGTRHDVGNSVNNMLAVLEALVSNDNCMRFAGGCRFQNEIVANLICDWLHTTRRLKYLKLWGKLQTPTAFRLAEVVATCQVLQKVEFGHLTIYDQEAKRALAETVLRNTNITYLYLYYPESHVQPVEGIWQLLKTTTNRHGARQRRIFRYAYIPDCDGHHLELLLQNNLVEHLHVQRCSHMLPSIANGLGPISTVSSKIRNNTLKILDLSRHTYNTSEIKPLWKSIQHHPCIEIISFQGASFVIQDEKEDGRSDKIVSCKYLSESLPEMAGIARVLFVNRSRWLRQEGGNSNNSPTTLWPQVISQIQSQLHGLSRFETLYFLLRHRLDWIPPR